METTREGALVQQEATGPAERPGGRHRPVHPRNLGKEARGHGSPGRLRGQPRPGAYRRAARRRSAASGSVHAIAGRARRPGGAAPRSRRAPQPVCAAGWTAAGLRAAVGPSAPGATTPPGGAGPHSAVRDRSPRAAGVPAHRGAGRTTSGGRHDGGSDHGRRKRTRRDHSGSGRAAGRRGGRPRRRRRRGRDPRRHGGDAERRGDVRIALWKRGIVTAVRLWLVAILALAGWPASPVQAATAMITGVTLVVAPSELQVTVAASGPVRYHAVDLNPRWTVVDVEGAQLGMSGAPSPIRGGPIEDVRVSQHTPGVVRVIVALSRPTTYRLSASPEGSAVVIGIPVAAGPSPAPSGLAQGIPGAPGPSRSITLKVRDMEIIDVLAALAKLAHANIVTDATVRGRITVQL